MTKFLRHLPAITLLLVLIGWTFFLYFFPPAEAVETLGIRNGYALAFVLAFFGGLSTFITVPYHLAVATLGAGGLNPLFLGIAAGTGIFLGDSISYLIGYRGHGIVPSRLQKIFQRFCGWCLTHPTWLASTVIFLYGALVPFSNDFITISMGLARFPYWRLMIPLGLGNVVFNTGAALAGAYGLQAIFHW